MAMVLGLNATAPPTLKVNPSTANFTIPGQVTVFVLDKNKTAQVAFVLGMVSVGVHGTYTAKIYFPIIVPL